jgi:hypothetical protein
MGFIDALTGRSKQAQPDLSRLFALSGAAIDLQVTENLIPTLTTGVCFKRIETPTFAEAHAEILGLLNEKGDENNPSTVSVRESTDSFNYQWIVLDGADFNELVTRTHFVNSTLADHGFGPQLLCSVFGFRLITSPVGSPATHYLVYLFKQGSFYPFVPNGKDRRDNEAELRIQREIEGDLTIESDLTRWFPMWDLPL